MRPNAAAGIAGASEYAKALELAKLGERTAQYWQGLAVLSAQIVSMEESLSLCFKLSHLKEESRFSTTKHLLPSGWYVLYGLVVIVKDQTVAYKSCAYAAFAAVLVHAL